MNDIGPFSKEANPPRDKPHMSRGRQSGKYQWYCTVPDGRWGSGPSPLQAWSNTFGGPLRITVVCYGPATG